MSYSEISGLELFQMPFSHHSARHPQAAKHQDAGRQQQPAAASTKAPQQSGRQTAVQHPAVHKPDITPPKCNADEIKNAMPAADAKTLVLEKAGKTQTDSTTKQPSAAKPEEQTETQQKELVLDMSSGSWAISNNKSDDTARRKAHEAAEAKRKAEWDARQLEKKQKEEAAIQKLHNMSDSDIIAASTKRISTDVERITRRNMKECVAEHIQNLCRKDPAFARKTMHPGKSMINCFRYINRKAKEYVQQEMKDNDVNPDNGIYGCDVPDGMVYQWAEEYMHNTDTPEDQEKDKKFVPRPYTGTKTTASKTKKPAKEKPKQETSGTYEQMSFV